MNFEQLAGKRTLGIARPKDYGAWAESLLMAGEDSENVAILAGIALEKYPDTHDLEDYFQRSLRDLSLTLPTETNSLQSYAAYLCEQMVLGNLKPEQGLRILQTFYSRSDYEPIFSIWDELDEDIYFVKNGEDCIFNDDLTQDNIQEFILKVAKQFIQLLEVQLPPNFYHLCVCKECDHIGESQYERIEKPWIPENFFRSIFGRNPNYQSICSKCGAPFPGNMSDYAARQRYLDLISPTRVET